MSLTDIQIRNARPSEKPQKLTDGDGLYLEVKPTGAKLWRYRYRIEGKENTYALGVYPEIGLRQAREELREARKLVKQSIHPAHHRKDEKRRRAAENKNTFEAVAKEWIEQNKKNWSGTYLRQVERTLNADVYKKIGTLPAKNVTPAHLLDILKKVEKRAPTVAILLRQWFSGIFRYAVSTLRAEYDPAASLKGAITRPRVQHHKPLSPNEIPKFLKALDSYGGYRTTVIALRLLLYLFTRPVELRAAEWSEFDLESGEPQWRIPARRMKMRETHIVPLSSQAVGLLKELNELTGGQKLLFPNYRRPRTYMTATTLNRALERMGYGGRFSSHGFRATASTILNELGYRSELIERQLAHAERNKSRASYNQAQYLADRREMMQAWADYLDGLATGAEVVPMNASRNKSA